MHENSASTRDECNLGKNVRYMDVQMSLTATGTISLLNWLKVAVVSHEIHIIPVHICYGIIYNSRKYENCIRVFSLSI